MKQRRRVTGTEIEGASCDSIGAGHDRRTAHHRALKDHRIPGLIRGLCISMSTIVAMVSIGCGPSPIVTEYQVVSFIPIPDAYVAKLVVDGRELYCFFTTESRQGWRDSLHIFNITDPAEPRLTRAEAVPVSIDVWNMDYCAHYVLTYSGSTGKLRALNLLTLEYAEVFIHEMLRGLAFKKGLLFGVADSGLMIWDINDVRNPVRIFSAAESVTYYSRIAVSDTVGFEASGWPSVRYRIWNFADPHLPFVVGEGDFDFECLGEVVIADGSIFLQRNEQWIERYEFGGSGPLRRADSTFYAKRFLIHDQKIMYLMNEIIRIGDAFDFSTEAVDVPVPEYVWAIAAADDVIYAAVNKKGIFVYRSKGD